MALTDFTIRLLIIIGVSFLIGLERKLTGHHASFATTMLIAIGSYVFFSIELYVGTQDTRIPANIITGIGFLCSGVIFKQGASVNGLNTAATLWSTAAISVLIGFGRIFEGLIAASLLIVINIIMHYIAPKIKPIKSAVSLNNNTYDINIECLESDVKKVRKIIVESVSNGISLESMEMDTLTGTKCRMSIRVTAEHNPDKTVTGLVDRIYEKDVISVSFTKAEG